MAGADGVILKVILGIVNALNRTIVHNVENIR